MTKSERYSVHYATTFVDWTINLSTSSPWKYLYAGFMTNVHFLEIFLFSAGTYLFCGQLICVYVLGGVCE